MRRLGVGGHWGRLVGRWGFVRTIIESGKEVRRREWNFLMHSGAHQILLRIRWYEATCAASVPRISPAMNAREGAPGHPSDFAKSTANFYDSASWFHHGR